MKKREGRKRTTRKEGGEELVKKKRGKDKKKLVESREESLVRIPTENIWSCWKNLKSS